MSSCDHGGLASQTCGWCPSCGEPVDRRVFCPTCHHSLNPEDQVCSDPSCRAPRPAAGWRRLPAELAAGYQLKLQLGRGPSGAVYAATGPGNAALAARVVNLAGKRPETAQQALDGFARECALQPTLGEAPFVVRALDSGKTGEGIPFLITEQVRGSTLEQLLGAPAAQSDATNPTRAAVLEPVSAVRQLRRLVAAVGRLHRLKLVHRQLRPSSVFVLNSPQGDQLKLADLGLVWSAGLAAPLEPLSPELVSRRAAPYLAPEVVRGQQPPSPAADIYSVGVMAYELLTGRLPYVITDAVRQQQVTTAGDISVQRWGAVAAVWLKAHLVADLVPPDQVRPDLPEALVALLQDCLQREPTARVQSTNGLVMQLAVMEQELARNPVASFSPPPAGVSAPQPEPAVVPAPQPVAAPAAPPAPAAPARVAVAPQPLVASLTEGTGRVMGLAMERDTLALEVAQLRQELARAQADNQQLRQQLGGAGTSPGEPRAAAPNTEQEQLDNSATQQLTPVPDEAEQEQDQRDRYTQVLPPGMLPEELPPPPKEPAPPPAEVELVAQKKPFGGDLDQLETQIAPPKMLDQARRTEAPEAYLDTELAINLPHQMPTNADDDAQLEHQPTNLLATDDLGLEHEEQGEVGHTMVVPGDEIFDAPTAAQLAASTATTELKPSETRAELNLWAEGVISAMEEASLEGVPLAAATTGAGEASLAGVPMPDREEQPADPAGEADRKPRRRKP